MAEAGIYEFLELISNIYEPVNHQTPRLYDVRGMHEVRRHLAQGQKEEFLKDSDEFTKENLKFRKEFIFRFDEEISIGKFNIADLIKHHQLFNPSYQKGAPICNVSHKQAVEKTEREFEIYRKREMDLLESDFDREVKRLRDKK